MHLSITVRVLALLAIVGLASGCANTIRGAGQDTANVVDAAQDAGRDVAGSAETY